MQHGSFRPLFNRFNEARQGSTKWCCQSHRLLWRENLAPDYETNSWKFCIVEQDGIPNCLAEVGAYDGRFLSWNVRVNQEAGRSNLAVRLDNSAVSHRGTLIESNRTAMQLSVAAVAGSSWRSHRESRSRLCRRRAASRRWDRYRPPARNTIAAALSNRIEERRVESRASSLDSAVNGPTAIFRTIFCCCWRNEFVSISNFHFSIRVDHFFFNLRPSIDYKRLTHWTFRPPLIEEVRSNRSRLSYCIFLSSIQ